MDVNLSAASIISGVTVAAVLALAKFVFDFSQRITKAETKLEFIYERLRWSIATDIKSNPHPDDAKLEELTQSFLQRNIGRSNLKTLVEILEARIKEHPIEKERMKAENLLELIRFEYQLGGRMLRSLNERDKDAGTSIHGFSRRMGH